MKPARKTDNNRAMSDAEIKMELSSNNGRWVSAKEIARQLGISWQCAARRLAKLASFNEVDSKEIHVVSTRYRIRTSHLYRAWGSTIYPSWLASSFNESQIVGAKMICGRASLRKRNRKVPIGTKQTGEE